MDVRYDWSKDALIGLCWDNNSNRIQQFISYAIDRTGLSSRCTGRLEVVSSALGWFGDGAQLAVKA